MTFSCARGGASVGVLLAALILLASGAIAAPVRTPHVEAELVAGSTAIEPGKPLTVALRLKMAPGWHTYWRNPGDSGLPTQLSWKLPAGYTVGAIQWPAPERLPAGPLMNFGYEGEVLLLTDIGVTAASAGPVTIAARAGWLVCNPERCIPINSSNPRAGDYKTPAQMQAWMKQKSGAPGATLLDESGKVGRAYGARTTPHMYIIDPKGQTIYAGAIDNKPTANPADVKTAKNFVRTAMGEALAGKPVSTASTTPYGCTVKY